MTDKLELKSSHEVVYTVYVADVESIFYCKPDDPDILTVLMKDGKRLYCDEVCPIDSLQKKPVSEDLEEAVRGILKNIEPDAYHTINQGSLNEREEPAWSEELVLTAIKAGALWQKEVFEKNRLEHCDSITEEQYNLVVGFIDSHIDKYNRMPTFLDAIEYGMEKMKEQMMKDATEVTVHIDAGGYPYTPEIELYDYDKDIPLAKMGDKYKVVLIKED